MNKTGTKKILFVLPYLYAGGAERALITLMNNLDRETFSSEIIVIKEGGDLRSLIRGDIPYHALSCSCILTSFPSLLRAVKRIRPDVVCTTMVQSNFLVMGLKPFMPRTKFIIREAVVPSSILAKHRLKSFFIKALYKVLYPRADYVVSPSQSIVDEFYDMLRLNVDNHVVIYNQVDLGFIESHLNRHSEHNDSVQFCCAGRLHYQKGYDRLIEALCDFNPGFNWTLSIMGDGEERERLERQISALKMGDKVKLLGHCAQPWQIIYDSDCLLLPSRWEGMPNIVLESLACGTPVIAMAEANGVSEIAAHHNSQAIAVAQTMGDFIDLMADRANVRLKNKKTSMLSEEFTLSNVTKQYETLFN